MRLKCAVLGLVCVLAASAVAASASIGSKAAKAPTHLAFIAFALPGVDILTPMTAGAKVAQAALNAGGGFGGSKIALDFCNGQLSPAVDVACAHSTLNKHPVAMIGCESTWTSSGLPIYSAAKVPSVQCPE